MVSVKTPTQHCKELASEARKQIEAKGQTLDYVTEVLLSHADCETSYKAYKLGKHIENVWQGRTADENIKTQLQQLAAGKLKLKKSTK